MLESAKSAETAPIAERFIRNLGALTEAEQHLLDQRQKIISRAEPSTLVRNNIIEKQGQLLDMLYDESSATSEMREIKKEIDRDRQRLDERPLSRMINHGI